MIARMLLCFAYYLLCVHFAVSLLGLDPLWAFLAGWSAAILWDIIDYTKGVLPR